jgi:protein-L-isoaspartate(D-aspartate) O-methyltransferase
MDVPEFRKNGFPESSFSVFYVLKQFFWRSKSPLKVMQHCQVLVKFPLLEATDVTDTFFPRKKRIYTDNLFSNDMMISEGLRNAISLIDRMKFTPSRFSPLVFEPVPIPIGYSRNMRSLHDTMQLLAAAELQPAERVLEVGTGSGYITALLSRIASHVYSVDDIENLVEEAQERMHEIGLQNISFQHGTPFDFATVSPFDVILYTNNIPWIPNDVLSQLGIGGRLVAMVQHPHTQQLSLVRLTRTNQGYIIEETL